MLHKFGSQVCFQNVAKRYFDIFYGKYLILSEMASVKVIENYVSKRLKGAAAKFCLTHLVASLGHLYVSIR
jgi:hypothetical protein